jgi:putative peptide zinc metalloprotease protein
MNDARPRLRAELRFVEQVFRGEASFVVKDPGTNKYFRFRPAEARVLRCLDGTRTYTDVARALAAQGMAVPASAVEAFARRLQDIGLIERSLAERTTLQLERLRAERRHRRRTPLFRGELLRMRWSLGDPDGLFDRTMPYVRWCFTRPFLVASALLFAAYFVILAATWSELSAVMAARFTPASFTPGSFALLWGVFLIVTVVHELAHGYACKHFGGEVHELGLMVIYLQPAMYCNVNDAWSFPELRSRLWVTAAGGWIELVVAGVAALVWAVAAPGTLLADTAVATMVVAGGLTLLANGNPLLPLDGYFALTDYLEIPNLRLRALEYVRWWAQRHLLRIDHPEPAVTERERRVFLVYGSLATLYIALVFVLAARLFLGWARAALGVTGVVLAVAALGYWKRRPITHLWRSIVLSVRGRSHGMAARAARRRRSLAAAVLLLLLLAAPWPHVVTGSFVAAPAQLHVVTAASDGVIAQVLVAEGTHVKAGAPLLQIRDFALMQALAQATRLVDSLATLEGRARAQGRTAAAEVIAAEGASESSRLGALQRLAAATTVRAVSPGVVLTSRPADLLGRHVTAGLPLLSIGDADSVELRVAFTGDGAAGVRVGQMVRVITDADAAHPSRAMVASRGATASPGTVEARVRVPAVLPWRYGVTGEARAEVGRSTVLGALVRAVRSAVRGDLLL